jgi:outer membrane receptor protein involved in Fe transport
MSAIRADSPARGHTIARMNASIRLAASLALLLPPLAVLAQPDAPPRLPPGTSTAPVAAPRAEPPAAVLRDAKPAPAKADSTVGPIVEDEALADLPAARTSVPEARIEQRRQGNRVVELTVTPAGSTRSYVIVNREGQRPLSVQELSAGLSTPRFLRFDF